MNESTLHTNQFIIQRSELENRWDPEMILYQRQTVNEYKFKTKKIAHLLKSNPQYGANEAGVDRTSNDIPRYIRITDIEEDGTLKSDLGKTAKKIDSKYFLNDKDVLFARSGNTVGKSYIHKKELYDYDCFFAGYMIRFVFDENQISPEYAFIFTQSNFYKKWVKATQRTAGQPNINAEEYKTLQIPIPDSNTQQKIIKLYQTAYKTKRLKEEKAKELLDSINPYILDELGICLLTKDYSLEGRIFTVNNSDVNGDRIDPDFYLPYYSQLVSLIQQKKYAKLSQIIKFSSESWNQKDYYEDTFPYIEISEINLSTGKIMNVNSIPIGEAPSRAKMVVKTDDIIVSLTRPHRGAIARIEKENNRSIASTGFAVLRKLRNDEVSKDYLFEVLRNPLVLKQLKQRSTGGNYPAITMDELGKVLIPIASKAKQDEIVKHINDLRERAKKLQEEAQNLLTQAQSRIEKMILN